MISKLCIKIFNDVLDDYHMNNSIDQTMQSSYRKNSFEYFLYLKCWIDNIQWHMEDLIRDPNIDPLEGLKLKRKIDKSNQDRTNVVELIDDYFLEKYRNVVIKENAKTNSESPAWIIDRLSILALKIFHMREETVRSNASENHRNSCVLKLQVLQEQNYDLSNSLDELINDIQLGYKYMKVYKQMKMYNDSNLNPILYNK